MNKKVFWSTLLLGLLGLIILCWNKVAIIQLPIAELVTTAEPTYQSQYTCMVAYKATGEMNYTLMARKVSYFSEKRITFFTHPVATVFDKNIMPSWIMKANNAKLTHDKMLYLYGDVRLSSLTDTSYLKQIVADNAVLNLLTQDISSDNKVTLYGTGFSSTGMKMRGNLRKKTTELIEKVQTSYELRNLPSLP